MTLSASRRCVPPTSVSARPCPDELEDLVSGAVEGPILACRVTGSRRFKNHQEKLKSGGVYQVAKCVRNLAAATADGRSLSAAERTMYERARINLIQRDAPALKVSAEEARAVLDVALAPRACSSRPRKPREG